MKRTNIIRDAFTGNPIRPNQEAILVSNIVLYARKLGYLISDRRLYVLLFMLVFVGLTTAKPVYNFEDGVINNYYSNGSYNVTVDLVNVCYLNNSQVFTGINNFSSSVNMVDVNVGGIVSSGLNVTGNSRTYGISYLYDRARWWSFLYNNYFDIDWSDGDIYFRTGAGNNSMVFASGDGRGEVIFYTQNVTVNSNFKVNGISNFTKYNQLNKTLVVSQDLSDTLTVQGKSDGGYYTRCAQRVKNSAGLSLACFGGSGVETVDDYSNFVFGGNISGSNTILSDMVFASMGWGISDKRAAVIRVLKQSSSDRDLKMQFISPVSTPAWQELLGLDFNRSIVNVSGRVVVLNNISANYYFGDGSMLTGVGNEWRYNQTCQGMTLYNTTFCKVIVGGTTQSCFITAPAGMVDIEVGGWINGTTSHVFQTLYVNNNIVDMNAHSRAANANPTNLFLQNVSTQSTTTVYNATVTTSGGVLNWVTIKMEAYKPC